MSNINIVKPSADFEFDKMVLGGPTSLTSQTFFSKLTNDNQEFFLMTPPCKLKNGFITSSKTTYCDLVFKNSDEIVSFMENFENVIQKMIYARREKWFHDSIEMDDIENIFTSPLKSYKSGKYFTLRAFTNSPRNIVENNIKVYDQYDNELGINNIKNDDSVVCILHVNGLKFSSKIFQVYFELKQVVVLNETNDPFSKNLIVTKQDSVERVEPSKECIVESSDDLTVNPVHKNNNNIVEKMAESKSSRLSSSLPSSLSPESSLESKMNNKESESLGNIYNDDNDNNDKENNSTKELNEVDISMPECDETFVLSGEVATDVKEHRKEQYFKAKSKAIEARLNALKMIAEANSLKNTMLLDNELLGENDEYDDDLSLGDLDELSDTQSDYSYSNEGNNNDDSVMENIAESDTVNIDLVIEELGKLSNNEVADNDEGNKNNLILKEDSDDQYDSDSSTSSSGLDSESERITIHY